MGTHTIKHGEQKVNLTFKVKGQGHNTNALSHDIIS